MLIRIQEVRWYHEQKFASMDKLTEEGLEIAQKNRKYSMEVDEKSVFTRSYATITYDDICQREEAPILSLVFKRNNTPTYTYSGAIFGLPDNKITKILCVS
ncbi:MAG: hypothetical protein AAGE96_17575 [Cyanobacteria bacterium P01_G01_bin.19]